MCSSDILSWIEKNLSEDEVRGRRVLEIGSYDVNGSLRSIILPFEPESYVGTDMRAGPGVDVVCRAEALVAQFGEQSFDIVLSSCAFEHIRDWRTALLNMKRVCSPGGLLVFIVPDQCPYHGYPHDFWRYDQDDIVALFADFELLHLERQPGLYSIVCAKFCKPHHFVERKFSHYSLYSIVTGRRVEKIRMLDFLSVPFAQVLWRDALKLKVVRFVLALQHHRKFGDG